jgi:hypothetical protein
MARNIPELQELKEIVGNFSAPIIEPAELRAWIKETFSRLIPCLAKSVEPMPIFHTHQLTLAQGLLSIHALQPQPASRAQGSWSLPDAPGLGNQAFL